MKTVSVSIIVPTLNEEKYINLLFKSLESQSFSNFEVIVVDGGSNDATIEQANRYKGKLEIKTIVLEGAREFYSRDFAADIAKGPILVFTCADVLFPPKLLEKVYKEFEDDNELLAMSGPYVPYSGPAIVKIEYALFNLIKHVKFKLHYGPLPSGTHFLAVKKSTFQQVGGFLGEIRRMQSITGKRYPEEPLCIDGYIGKELWNRFRFRRVRYCPDAYVWISTRHTEKMNLVAFNNMYFYCVLTFLPYPVRLIPWVDKLFYKLSMLPTKGHRGLHKSN